MKRCSLILTLLTFLLSCSNLSLETESVTVSAVEDGAVLKEGDSFIINIRNISSSIDINPTIANVSILYESENRDLEDEAVEPIDLTIDLKSTPKPELTIGENFKEGVYSLYITVLENDSVLSEYESKFMVFNGYINGELESLAPMENLYTNSLVMMSAKVKASDNIDPYLVWKYNETIISEGFLSQGYDSVIWDSGNLSGFVDIELFLYPFKITDDFIESKNVISYTFIVNPLSKSLFSQDALSLFSKAFYFNGNYIDELNKHIDVIAFNQAYPRIDNGFYGMEMGVDRGFKTENSIFTFTNGDIDSFSVVLKLKPESLDDGRILEFGNNSLSSSINILNEELVNTLSVNGVSESYTIKKIESLDQIKLVLTYIWNGTGFDILYYVNGESYDMVNWNLEEVLLNNSLVSDSDYFIIGGDSNSDGAQYILDTFEVVNRDKDGNNNVYQNLLLDSITNNSQYKILEGFNSIVVPENYQGKGTIDGEYLNMIKNDTLSYLNLFDYNSNFTLDVKTLNYSEYNLLLLNDVEPITIDCYGSTIIQVIDNKLLIDKTELLTLENNISGLKLIPKEDLSLDSITLLAEEVVLE